MTDGAAAGLKIVALLLTLGLPLCGILALILGIVALVRIRSSNGALRGRGLAIGAIVLGSLMLLATPVLLVGGLVLAKGKAAEAQRRTRMMQQAEDSEAAKRSAAEAPEAAAVVSVTIVVSAEGPDAQTPVFRIGDWQTSDVAVLEAKLAGMRTEDRQLHATVSAASDCPYRHVQAAIDACRKAGCDAVSATAPVDVDR